MKALDRAAPAKRPQEMTLAEQRARVRAVSAQLWEEFSDEGRRRDLAEAIAEWERRSRAT